MKAKILERFSSNTLQRYSDKNEFDHALNSLRIDEIKDITASVLSLVTTYMINNVDNDKERDRLIEIAKSHTEEKGLKQLIAMVKTLEEFVEILEKNEVLPVFEIVACKIISILSIIIEECDFITKEDLSNNIDDVVENLNNLNTNKENTKFVFKLKKINFSVLKGATSFEFTKFLNVDTKVVIEACSKTKVTKTFATVKKGESFDEIITNDDFINKILRKVVDAVFKCGTLKEELRKKGSREFFKSFANPLEVTLYRNEEVPKRV